MGDYFLGHAPVGIQGFIYENGNFETFDAFNFFSEETATMPMGINDFGEITGVQLEGPFGMYASFIATPVPEPRTLGLIGTGLLMIAGAMRRRLC